MTKPKVIFRADGSSSIGLGHITRCCALADMLKHDFKISFYTRANLKRIVEEIKNYSDEVVVLDETISYSDEAGKWISVLNGDEIVVLDGYNFNTEYQTQIKNKGNKLACIDDIHAYHFVADVVINHSPGATKNSYSAEPYTRGFLGADYVLLRKIFLEEAAKPTAPIHPGNSSVFICFGGADPDNVTQQILEKVLHLFPGKNINVVVGSAYMHLQTLQAKAEESKTVILHKNISPAEMLNLMQQSNTAITAASAIALEYICVKGNLFLVLTAENQKDLYKSLIETGCANELEVLFNNSVESMEINQCNLIDGKSSKRLLQIFNDLAES